MEGTKRVTKIMPYVREVGMLSPLSLQVVKPVTAAFCLS